MSVEGHSERLSVEEFASWWHETGEHELQQVLLWRWDPIGVSDCFPNTADEYDGYAPQIVQALRNGASEEEIAHMLAGIEHDSIGLAVPAATRLRPIAEFLRSWFENSQDSWRRFGPVRR